MESIHRGFAKMKSFVEWLEANANQTTMGVNTSSDMPYDSGSQASFQYDPRYPVKNPGDHWAFRMFKNFYANGWGSWGEVEQAAARNPQIGALMNKIQQTLETQGLGSNQPQVGIDGEQEFDIDKPSLMQQFATQLRRSVQAVMPNHGNGGGAGGITTSLAPGGGTPPRQAAASTQRLRPQNQPQQQRPGIGPSQSMQQSQQQPSQQQLTEIIPLL